MGFDYRLPQSLNVVTVKKRLIIPVSVQLESNPNEGAFQYLTKNRKHFMQSLDGILLDWNAVKIRLKNKAVPPYFQARVTIKAEFTILRVQQGDSMTALIVDQKPSAIVARTLENFLVHIEIPNEEIVFSPGDEVQFTFNCFDWEDMNPVIYGVNPVQINILQHPVISDKTDIERENSVTQQKRKIIDTPSTGPIRKKTRIEMNQNNEVHPRIESEQTTEDPGDNNEQSEAREISSTAHESPQRVVTSKEKVGVEANKGVSIESNERNRCSEVELIENEINTDSDDTTEDESILVEPEIINYNIDCVKVEVEIKSELTPDEMDLPPVEITECDPNLDASEFSRTTTPKLSKSQTPKSQRRRITRSESTPSVSSCSLMGQSDDCAFNSPNLLESENIVDMAKSLEQASTTQSSPKSKEKELPPGWTSRLHTCSDKKRKYHTYYSPLNRSFTSRKKAWEHHRSMMQSDTNQDNVNESVQLSNSQIEIKGIKSFGSKSAPAPLDDDYRKKMKLVISCQNDDFLNSKEGPTKFEKGHKKKHTDDAKSGTDKNKGSEENNADELQENSDTQRRKHNFSKGIQGKGVMSIQRKKKKPKNLKK